MATTAASHKRAVYSYNWAENVIPSWSGLHDSFNISHTVRISTQSHRNFKNKILLNTEPNTKIIHRWYFLFDNAFVRNHGLFRRLRNPGVNAESFGNILLPHRFFFFFSTGGLSYIYSSRCFWGSMADPTAEDEAMFPTIRLDSDWTVVLCRAWSIHRVLCTPQTTACWRAQGRKASSSFPDLGISWCNRTQTTSGACSCASVCQRSVPVFCPLSEN